jgi:diphthine synthase
VTGLSLYNFGQTTSMVFFTESWKPASFYDRLAENAKLGLHSLVLLDIKVKEPDLEALTRTGRLVYEPPRFMTAARCAEQMLEIEEEKQQGLCAPGRLGVGVARVASENQVVVSGRLDELAKADLGAPLHSFVLLGSRTYDLERDFLKEYAVNVDTFEQAWKDGGYGAS